MKTQGTLKSIDISYPSRKAVVSFEVTASPEDIEQYREMDLDISFDKHREKRSLDSNAYFHKLCDLLRQTMGISMAECKNHLIASYGQVEYIGEKQAVIKTNIEPNQMYQQEYLHVWCIKTDPEGAYWYRVYRGSHTYNTAEMAKLIEGTVTECKAVGIETATPEEIRMMNERWGLRQQEQEEDKPTVAVQGVLNLDS